MTETRQLAFYCKKTDKTITLNSGKGVQICGGNIYKKRKDGYFKLVDKSAENVAYLKETGANEFIRKQNNGNATVKHLHKNVNLAIDELAYSLLLNIDNTTTQNAHGDITIKSQLLQAIGIASVFDLNIKLAEYEQKATEAEIARQEAERIEAERIEAEKARKQAEKQRKQQTADIIKAIKAGTVTAEQMLEYATLLAQTTDEADEGADD